MPQALTIRVKRPFPHRVGMGAAPMVRTGGAAGNRFGTWGGNMPPIMPNPIQVSGTSSGTITPGPQGGMVRIRPWQTKGSSGQSNSQSNWQGSSQGWQGGYNQQSQSGGSGQPTQADLLAFTEALQQASAAGVITPGQAGSYQSAANTATDAQIQQLTIQLNELMADTPSAVASTAAQAVAAPATTTSWWSGSTTLFGSTVSNSTLAIGAGVLAVLGYAALRKK